MGRVNNTIDKFGRQRVNEKVQLLRGIPGNGFKLTSDGQYDIEGKCLSNVAQPTKDNDAATRLYVFEELYKSRKQLFDIINKDFFGLFDRKQEDFEEKNNKLLAALEHRVDNLEKSQTKMPIHLVLDKDHSKKKGHK